jgi:hypothetical protein
VRGIVLVTALWLPLAGCRDADVVTSSYATLQEAEQAGAVERRWMPKGLPPGTHDLREAHDPDGNRQWGLFSFPRQEAAALQGLLQPIEVSVEGQVCDAPRRIEWWPVLLRDRLDPERIRATGLRVYRSTDGSLFFAVNWNQGRAYYWTPAPGGATP